MNKQTITTLLFLMAGVLWLIVFLVMTNSSRILALFVALTFLFLAFFKMWTARKAS